MSRSNKNVRRSNDKGRLARRARGEAQLPKMKEQPRIPVESLVIPDGSCKFFTRKPKARFGTRPKADRALAQAQKQRARLGSGHVEKRVYKCPEGGCGGWHLTSREEFDDKAFQQRQKSRAVVR